MKSSTITMVLELKRDIIYGPVNSRRLGRSLGLNILPANEKMCSFNCIYCQYGWTEYSQSKNHSIEFPNYELVLFELENALKNIVPSPAYITFSGNGEPTLHPQFPEIVDGILILRKKWCPESKTAILSNSSTVANPKIKNALEKLDFRIMKLDAGEPDTFRVYNRPDNKTKFETIISGLSQLKDVTIQSLFSTGKQGNFHPRNISNWIDKIKTIAPLNIQIYSLDRPTACSDIKKLETKDLYVLKEKLKQEKIRASIY